MDKALEGIRIIDFTRYYPGPFATMRLQERGAEVIKVEDKYGDPARYIDADATLFRSVNWGKKFVSCDLKQSTDREKIMKLISGCDVLLEGFRPGVTKRLGIDYESVVKIIRNS